MATTTTWKGGTGVWQTAANWTNGAPTTPTSFAIINAPGTYKVFIGQGLEYHVGAVSLNDAGATLAVAGILDLTNRLTLTEGTLALTGSIAGGTIVANGGKAAFSGAATLDDTAYWGTLDLGRDASLTVKNGLTMHAASGAGNGTINLSGNGTLKIANRVTIANADIEITGGLNGGGLDIQSALTMSANSTILDKGRINLRSGSSLVNKGQLTVTAASQTLGFAGSKMINRGGLLIGKRAVFAQYGSLENTGTVTLQAGSTFTAHDLDNTANGTISVAAGSTFAAGVDLGGTVIGSFSNEGTINANDATLTLDNATGALGTLNISNSIVDFSTAGTSTTSQLLGLLANKNNQLKITYTAAIDDGETLDLPNAAAAGFKSLAYSATIFYGVEKIGASFSGKLTKTTIEGPLNVKGPLTIHDVTFTGSDGTGPGTLNLNGRLFVQADYPGPNRSYVINNVNISAASGSAINASKGSLPSKGSKLYFENATLEAGGDFKISAASIENYETFVADGARSNFSVLGYSFTNYGTISVQNGAEFTIDVGTFQNIETNRLIGGTYIVGAHSTLNILNQSIKINILYANVMLTGPGATFLPAGLAIVGTGGALTLENGATQTLAPNFKIQGSVELAHSDLQAKTIDIAGGTLGGHGQVLAAVDNSGTIDASGGGLSISQGVTGTGQATIEDGAALAFGSDVSAGQTVTFQSASGRLSLGFAAGFAGTIVGFTPGDTIHLINTAATGVFYNATADTLTIKNNGTLVATLQLSGDYKGDTFQVAADGKGGTDITVTASSAAMHRFVEAIAAASPSDMASLAASAPASLQGSAAQLLAAAHG